MMQFISLVVIEETTVVTGVTADPRIGVGHSKVLSYDSKRGFGGACFLKI